MPIRFMRILPVVDPASPPDGASRPSAHTRSRVTGHRSVDVGAQREWCVCDGLRPRGGRLLLAASPHPIPKPNTPVARFSLSARVDSTVSVASVRDGA